MPDWDEDSPQLYENLCETLRGIRDGAMQRNALNVEIIREWHRSTLKGLSVPNRNYVGRFRGEPGLEKVEVKIGHHKGTPPAQVASELGKFNARLQQVLQYLDQAIIPETDLAADDLSTILEVCAWTHSEWVRIHPFANRSGRTARLLANAIALRYGLPPFVRLRPRPDHGYSDAANASMRANHHPLTIAFRQMLDAYLADEL